MAFWTGARPNELAALKWGDVDAARGIVRIRAGRYRGKEGPPKTASSVRDIDLLPAVVETFRGGDCGTPEILTLKSRPTE